jgi:c-di-GMP-binding flagellar brake protein YcgR
VNEEVYVEPTAGSPGFHTHVLGFKPGHFLLLEHPFKESGAHQIKMNDSMWIRCFQNIVFRFRTRVVQITTSPIPLLFVEFPKTVEEINLRESARKKIFIRATFLDPQDRQGDHSWEGYILDISDTGCLMWGDFVHLVDRDILLTFRIPWTGERIQVKARVVRCEVTDQGIQSGLKFVDVGEKTQERLNQFIASLENHRISRMVVESET